MPVLEVTVRGRVQGVGFRQFIRNQARGLGLTGRVANRADGSVRVAAEGERARLDLLLLAIRMGPADSRITGVEHEFTDGPLGLTGFAIE